MNKNDLMILIMAKKTLDYQKDPNPDNWVTISGAKVHLDEGGKIDGGAKGKFNGKSYSGTKKSRKPASGSSESSKKYESNAREAVEYWVNTHYKNPSDKNIKDSVESVRMQMESMVKSAERNLNDAKKTGKEDLIKKYQDKFDEAKGTLEALNNYYDGGTVKKEPENKPAAKKETKPEVGDKGMAFLKRMSVIHSSFDESTGYMARDVAEKLKEGKSLQEIKDYFYGNIEKWGYNKEQERKEVDHFIEAVKRADKGLDPWKKDEPKEQKKPAAKNSAAENLIDYVKEQLNIDLSKHRNTEREKRGQLLVNWKELDRNQKFAIQTLAQKGKFELIDNGGYGYILKPTKEPKLGAPKSAGKEDDVKQVEISFPGGYKGHFSQVPGEKDVIFDWDKMERMEIPGGLEAFLKKAKEKGIEVNENYTPEERKLEEYPPSRKDRRLARMNKLQSRASKHGRPPGSR